MDPRGLAQFYRQLLGATETRESLGARSMAFQPQANVRVYADPEGHPFCLFT